MHPYLQACASPDSPLAMVAKLEGLWQLQQLQSLRDWEEAVLRMVCLASTIVQEMARQVATKQQHTSVLQRQCWHTLSVTEDLQDSLQVLQEHHSSTCRSSVRSADGILQADQGVFPLFEDCVKKTLPQAIESIDLAEEAAMLGMHFWMCTVCVPNPLF